MRAVLFLNETWRDADGGQTSIYTLDDATSTFRATRLPVVPGGLMLLRADRALVGTAQTAQPRFTISMDFEGHYM